MDLMRDWLGPTIEQQLERVLRWKEQGPAGFPSSEKVPYEDDGSNLRVRLQEVGRLQILKFEAFQDPIKAVLSDSYTSIQATFASSVVKAYVSKYQTRITKDTQGGVIGIAQYEIVATHLGPKQSSVTLLVQDFQFCGCAGSATFGQPVPIQQRQRVGLLVRRLRELKSAEILDISKHSDENELASPSSRRPLIKTCIISDGSHKDDRHLALATQVDFHSQMSQNKELELTVADKVQSTKNISRSYKEARTAPNRDGSSENASRRTKNTNEDLLRLLAEGRKPGTLESSANRNTKDLMGNGIITDKPLSESFEKHGRAAEHSDSGQHSSPRRSAPQVTSSKKVLVKNHGETFESLHQEASGINGDGNLGESRYRTRQVSDDHVKEKDPRITPDREVRTVKKYEVHIQSSKAFTIDLRSENNTGEELTNDPWNGITRIRRRDARISKEQLKLLDHEHSWFPPQPGRRGPVANVPIAILQTLNAAAERCDENTEPAEEQRELDTTGSQRPSSNTGSEAEQDSDEENLSGWSSSSLPSAPDDQLPPDSSFESSVPPDRTSKKNVLLDQLAAEVEEKEMSSPTAPLAQVPSGSAGPGDPTQVAQLEPCDASRSDDELPSQIPTVQAQPLLGEDNVLSTKSFKCAAQPQEVYIENPISNHINDAIEPDDAVVGQTSERDLDGTSLGRCLQETFAAPGSAGAAANDLQVPKFQSPLRRSHSPDQSSDDDDDLESKIPQALGDENAGAGQEQVYGLVLPPLLPPSTAIQKGEPTLQVKRTPYHPKRSPGISPCINTSPALLPTEQDRSNLDSTGDGLAAGYSTLAEVVVPGTHGLHSDTNIAGNLLSRVGADGTVDDLLMYDRVAVENQQIKLETATRAYEVSNKSPFKTTSTSRGDLVVESEHPLDSTPYLPVVEERKHEKRKLADMDQLSPFVTKRRKRLKPPPALNFSQENRQTQDPSLIARQHRREFLASRKTHHPMNATDDLHDVVSQKTDRDAVAAQDAAQRTTSLPEESTSMELDQLPPDTITHVTAFESIVLGGNTALSEWKPPSGDHTPRNKSVELGDYLNLSRDRSNKASGLTASPQSSSTMASPSSPVPPTKGSVYDTFKSTYPKYSGGFEHFLGMCQRINGLLQAERMEHRSLWDDFVIRHRTDYRGYLLDCTDRGDDPIPYEKFYKHHNDEPLHHKHVLTPATLNDVITSIERTSAALQPERRSRSPAKALHNGPAIAKASPHEPCSPMKAREVVDLTLAGPAPRPTSATDHPSKLGRMLSWTEATKPSIGSPAYGNNFHTPKSALTRESTTPLQTPSRVFRGPTQTPKQPTPVQTRNMPVPSQPADQPVASADNVLDRQKSSSPHGTSDSNRSTVVEWLGNSSSDTESPSVPESPRPPREETEEDQWWRDRNTPFKAFTRAYASLKSVQGAMGTVDQEGILRPSPSQLDVLSWKL